MRVDYKAALLALMAFVLASCNAQTQERTANEVKIVGEIVGFP